MRYAIAALLLLAQTAAASGELEKIAVVSARVRLGLLARPVMPDKPPNVQLPVKPKGVAASGLHSHRCPYDGTVFSHGDDQFGKAASHACPACGRLVWEVYQPPAKQMPMPVFQSGGGSCPNGHCPLPTRRGRR